MRPLRLSTLLPTTCIALTALGQGFPSSPINWALPNGGLSVMDGSTTIVFGYPTVAGTASSYNNTGSENWTVLDMDGDGRPDLVATAQLNANGYVQGFSPASNSYWKVYLNNGSGFDTSPMNWSLPDGGVSDMDGSTTIVFGYYATNGTASSYHNVGSQNWTVADMNGDARPDLVVTAQLNANGYVQEFSPASNSYWKAYLNNGSGFNASSTQWALPNGGVSDMDGSTTIVFGYYATNGTASSYHNVGSENWTMADMDGDARPDLVVTAQLNANGYVQEFSPASNSYWKVYLNNGSGFNASSTQWALPNGGVSDMDGSTTIVFGYSATAGSASSYNNVGSENWSMADMDGDGRPDLVVTAQLNANGYVQEFSPASNSYWKVYRNNGSGFNASSAQWPLPNGGLSDMDGSTTIVFGYPTLGGGASSYNNVGSENWSTVDINGDGRPDLVVTAQLNANGYVQEFSPASNSYWKAYLNNGSGFNTSSTSWALPNGGLSDMDGSTNIVFGYPHPRRWRQLLPQRGVGELDGDGHERRRAT